MFEEEYISNEKRKLIEFCKNHFYIYLYGAGDYGKRYLDILYRLKVNVSGFVTTKSEKKEFCGLPVYNVNEIRSKITKNYGIIPTYLGSRVEDIKKNFNENEQNEPHILSLDHGVMVLMEREIHFWPIIKNIKEEFPLSTSRKKCSEWRNLLVIRLDMIGDLVCMTAFIRELKRNYPEGTVSVIIRKQNELLLKNCPYIDQLVLYESDSDHMRFLDECNNFEYLKEKVSAFMNKNFADGLFDAVFLPKEILCGTNQIVEILMALYSQADCRIGYVLNDGSIQKKCNFSMIKDIFSNLYYQTKPMHESVYPLDILSKLGLEVRDDRLELWPDNISRTRAEVVLKRNHINVQDKLIAVGLLGSIPVKNWRVENYKEVINKFYKKYGTEYKFIIFGGKDAVETAKQLAEDSKIVVDLTGKLELDETVACMEHCVMYIGSNTGLLHIATAVGKPAVTLYRALADSSDFCVAGPCRWGSRIKNSIELLPPSGLDGCYEVCKKRYSHCINQITPYQVERAIESILDINRLGE